MKKLFVLFALSISFISTANAQDGYDMFKVPSWAQDRTESEIVTRQTKSALHKSYKVTHFSFSKSSSDQYKINGKLIADNVELCTIHGISIQAYQETNFECGPYQAKAYLINYKINEQLNWEKAHVRVFTAKEAPITFSADLKTAPTQTVYKN